MDDLVGLALELIVHWRVGLATFVAIPIALFLADTLSWFSCQFGIVLVVIAFGAGLLWDMSAHARAAAAQARARGETRR